MAKGTVKGNSVHSSRGMKYRIAKGGKFDSREINGMLVEYRLVEPPGERPRGQGPGSIKNALVTKVLGRTH